MKKIIVIIFMFFVFPIVSFALDFPKVDSKYVEIYDLTDNKIIYEVKSNDKASIASLTKIVTTITAIENINNLDESLVVSDEVLSTVRWDASVAGLKVGDIVTYRDLLYASMLPSGADATNTIAILSSGSINNFVNKMNELVSKLDLKNTHFVNVTGLDDKNHYSTADDMRIILSYALNNDLFKKIYTTKEYTLSNGLKVSSTINKYGKNNDISKIIGSKTGFTLDAGYCLSSLSDINSHEFIIIVMNASNKNNKYYNVVDTIDLINFLNSNYDNRIIVNKDELVRNIEINLSDVENYEVIVNNDIKLYLPSEYDQNLVRIEYDGLEELSFKNKVGDKIGSIKYYFDNVLINEDEVILNKEININIMKVVKKYLYLIIICTSTIFAFIIYLLIRRKKKT